MPKMKIVVTVLVILSTLCKASKDVLQQGCAIGGSTKIKHCAGFIDVKSTSVIPYGHTCILDNGHAEYTATCSQSSSPIQTLKGNYRVKRLEPKPGQFTTIGTTIGTAFGPVGTAVGAAVGAVADLFCLFLCSSKGPPPNKAPQMRVMPTVVTPIVAQKNQLTAVVKWSKPVVVDQEDGTLTITTAPAQYSPGTLYGAGHHTVFFSATDSGGLSAQASLSFEVQVKRCGMLAWPDHGSMHCNRQDSIYGTRCTILCDKGYQVPGVNTSVECHLNEQWSHIPKDCEPKRCDPAPVIENGHVKCMNGKMKFDVPCEVVCDKGYMPSEYVLFTCDMDGHWPALPICKDNEPPAFLNNECPEDKIVDIDSVDNTAVVTWDIPTGSDNSNCKVNIVEIHGYTPGQRFNVSSYTVKYTIEDESGNKGSSCVFMITVRSVSCPPPDLLVPGKEHLIYTCPQLFTLGAQCSLSCSGGYPFAGSDKITCKLDVNGNRNWEWDPNGLKPFCKETNCTKLNEPERGAMACSQWTHGQMCQMQCQQGYDIPNIGDGQFVCGKSDGKWRPSNRVPGCNVKVNPRHMHMPSEFYYYTDQCNSSAENIQQIQNNFVQALNASKFHEDCVGVAECKANFVSVSCGSTTNRKRRSIVIMKRASGNLAYRIQFEIVYPCDNISGKTPQTIFEDTENTLYKMSDDIQADVDSGKFNIPGLIVDKDSYVPGIVQYKCPVGMMSRETTWTCVGCPIGMFLSENTGKCEECPYGFYQDNENSIACKQCPLNMNTTISGASSLDKCIEFCHRGHYSLSGLAPCAVCPQDFYMDSLMATVCMKCPKGTKTITTGSMSSLDCKSFDVKVKHSTNITSNTKAKTLALSVWAKVQNLDVPASFQILVNGSSYNLTVILDRTVSLYENGKLVDSAITAVTPMVWFHMAWTVTETEAMVYTDGKMVLQTSSIRVPRASVLDIHDVIAINGDVVLSGFQILSRQTNDVEIKTWADTCIGTATDVIFDLDDFLTDKNNRILVPSKCDAIKECASSPCGVHDCIDIPGGFDCRCKDGFSGRKCDKPPDYCASSLCQNRATCVSGTANYTCNCESGFKGAYCETQKVNGKWSEWVDFSPCSKTCGGGIKTRTRRCDSPRPDAGGQPCQGDATESRNCSTDKCPECLLLRQSEGVDINCNITDTIQRCTITCTPGLFFATPPLEMYVCGLETGYKWNHQDDSNPSATLPSCSKIDPPSSMSVSFDGDYETLPCTPDNLAAVKSSMEAKISQLDCVKKNLCTSSVLPSECMDSGSTGIRTTVEVMSDVPTDGNGFNIPDFIQNKTGPSADLVDFIKLTMELEKAARQIVNDSNNFFQVAIGGHSHTVNSGSSGIPFESSVRCPSGTVRLDVFCAQCPVGSYSDGKTVTFCPRGQYQDERGQSTCKQCPTGFTTIGIGSIQVVECSMNIKDILEDGSSEGGELEAVQICVGVSVTIALLILAAVAILLIYKKVNIKRRIKDNYSDQYADIYSSQLNMHSVPSQNRFKISK